MGSYNNSQVLVLGQSYFPAFLKQLNIVLSLLLAVFFAFVWLHILCKLL